MDRQVNFDGASIGEVNELEAVKATIDGMDIKAEINGLKAGTKSFTNLSVAGAADIYGGLVANNWQEATLLNGFTGSVYFRKTKTGSVEYRGVVVCPDPATSGNIVMFPSGYRNTFNYTLHSGINITDIVLIHTLCYPDGRIDLFETPVANKTYHISGFIAIP